MGGGSVENQPTEKKTQFIDYPAENNICDKTIYIAAANWAPCHNNNDISGQVTDCTKQISADSWTTTSKIFRDPGQILVPLGLLGPC